MDEDEQEYLSRLDDQIDDYQEHHELSFTRIEAWYVDDWEDEQEYAEILSERGFRTDSWKLDDLEAPHEKFAERAANFVETGIEVEKNGESKMDDEVTPNEIGEILVGTGIEMLVKGVVLKLKPEYFIRKSKPGEFVGFGDCKGCLLGVLGNVLSDEQKTYCRLGLKIAWDYRNNTVHAGYHKSRFAGHPYVVYHVTEFLFAEFFDSRTAVVDTLSERREELNRTRSREYPIIELP